jgi:phosphoglycolate phosphatase-like HAD superfamily hydrolase
VDRETADACAVAWEALVWDLDGTLTRPGRVAPQPGVAAVLAAWARRGTPMAVATSAGTSTARRVLDELGWTAFFGHVAGSAPGVWGKEAVVEEALLGLGRPLPDGAAGAVVIGDSPGDVEAAHRHGLLAVGVGWGASSAAALTDADLVVTDPGELAPPDSAARRT